MAGQIKGITIEFRGDTTKLDKAMRDINKEARNVQTELKSIDKALKFNPKNVELLRQKYDVLQDAIKGTREKLDVLKAAQQKADDAGVDKNSAEYRELQREIIKAESQLKNFNKEARKVKAATSVLGQASAKFKELGTNLTKAGQAMRGFSMAGAAVVGTLGAMAYKSSEVADDLNTMSKVYGISTTELQKYALTAEMVDVDLDTITKSHVKLEKSMMSAANGNKTNAAYFEQLGVAVTNADGSLRESDEVFNDVITALGGMEDETARDAVAMQLLGKSAVELNPLIQDNGETYKQTAEIFAKYGLDYIDQETLDKAAQFNDQLQLIRAMGTLAFQEVGAKLAELLLPALEKVVDWVGQLVGWLSNLDPRILMIIGGIAGLVAIIAPLLTGLGQLAFAISSIMGLMATLEVSFGGLIAAALPYIAVIAAIVAVGVTLYKNWDVIKAKAKALWTAIKTTFTNIKTSIVNAFNSVNTFLVNTFNNIVATAKAKFDAVKTAVVTPINKAKEAIQTAWNRIKSILSGKLSLPHIKLPHFKINGKFSLNPPSVPHLDVDWYKRGGIFNGPQVIGVGESGSEAVIPLDKLWSKMDEIISASGGGIVVNVYGSAGMDVNQLAAAVEERLVRVQKMRNKAFSV